MASYLTEHEYLKWFYQEADFGPAHDDVVEIINDNIELKTGKMVPVGYRREEEDE